MNLSSGQQGVMPSTEVKHLCRSLFSLVNAPLTQNSRLSPAAYRSILLYCGIRPDLSGWRRFLTALLTLLGLLSIVAGLVFFLAWNWAAMPKFTKFAVAELLIVALAVVVWLRWYDGIARAALLALGLSFGALFALYGQIYQTGADSWELFRAWALVLLPLALLGRQNGLWFCTWVITNLAFHLYQVSLLPFIFSGWSPLMYFVWPNDTTFCGYIVAQAGCLILYEILAAYVVKKNPSSWLNSRWFTRVMAAYFLLTLTPSVVEVVLSTSGIFMAKTVMTLWVVTLLVGYGYYRYRCVDLYMLTLGIVSIMVVGEALIIRLYDHVIGYHGEGDFFITGLVMVFWLVCGGIILLQLRRKLYLVRTAEFEPNASPSLLQQLHQLRLLNDEQVEEVEKIEDKESLPWYLRAALTVGSWVAALISFFLLLLLLSLAGFFNHPNRFTFIIPSLIIAVFAGILLRREGSGLQHIGLAWAITATCGLTIGIYPLGIRLDDDLFIYGSLCFLLVLAVMALTMRNCQYHFIAVIAFISTVILSLGHFISENLSPGYVISIISLPIACMLVLWFWVISRQELPQTVAMRELLPALFYGIPAGLILLFFTSMSLTLYSGFFWDYWYLPQCLGIGLFLGFVIGSLILAVRFRSIERVIYLPAAIFCTVITFFSPGLGFGLMLVLVSRYQGSKGLLVVASSFLMLYLVYWYTFLSVTLLQKSLLLLISGIILLGLAYVAKKWLPVEMGAINAN